jgi:hypothetical protein
MVFTITFLCFRLLASAMYFLRADGSAVKMETVEVIPRIIPRICRLHSIFPRIPLNHKSNKVLMSSTFPHVRSQSVHHCNSFPVCRQSARSWLLFLSSACLNTAAACLPSCTCLSTDSCSLSCFHCTCLSAYICSLSCFHCTCLSAYSCSLSCCH